MKRARWHAGQNCKHARDTQTRRVCLAKGGRDKAPRLRGQRAGRRKGSGVRWRSAGESSEVAARTRTRWLTRVGSDN